MFKRIIVAIDGSAASRRALLTAVDLARDQDASLDIVHVVESIEPVPMGLVDGIEPPAELAEAWAATMRRNGERILLDAARIAETRGVIAMTSLISSPRWAVATHILRQAKRLRAELVVLGTHGRRGLRRMVMGSDAETVLRESKVPVLIVRGTARTRGAVRKAGAGQPGVAGAVASARNERLMRVV